MPINLAGSYAAGGVHDALLEIVKQRMLEQELAQREEENRYQRARGERQDRRLDEQDRIAAEERQRQAVERKFKLLDSGTVPQADLNAQLGEDPTTAHAIPTDTPASIGGVPMPSGVKSYRLPAVPIQAKPMMVDGASIRPRSREQAMADEQDAADRKLANTPFNTSPGDIVQTGAGKVLARGGAAPEKWEPIEVSINGKNVQLERNTSGGYRYPVTQQAVTNGLGPKIPERQPQRDRYQLVDYTNDDGTIGRAVFNMDTKALETLAPPPGATAFGRPSVGDKAGRVFYERATSSNAEALKHEGYLEKFGPQMEKYLPNWFNSADYQMYRTSTERFVESLLRQESGKAVKDEEYVRLLNMYAIQPGDRLSEIRLKQQIRAEALKTMNLGLGNMRVAPGAGGASGGGDFDVNKMIEEEKAIAAGKKGGKE